MLKVLHVGPSDKLKGGISSVLRNFKKSESEFLSKGVKQEFFYTTSKRSLLGVLAFVLDVFCFLLKVRGGRVVHFHIASKGSFYRKFVLFLVAILVRRKVVIQIHGGGFVDFYKHSQVPTKKCIDFMLTKADLLLTVSSKYAMELSENIPSVKKIGTVFNSSPEFEGLACEKVITESQDILFCGALTHHKGLGDLICAINLVNKKIPSVVLRIAGGGPQEEWKQLARDYGVEQNVEFLGWIEGAQKIKEYQRATVFCLPSHYESFGIAALEAMHLSKAIVATTTGGLPDLVENEIDGLLSAPGDVEQLALNLIRVLTDGALALRLGCNAQKKAKRLFTTKAAADELIKSYKFLS